MAPLWLFASAMAKGGKKLPAKGKDGTVEKAEDLPDNLDEMDEAAAAIQAQARGRAVRKQQKFEIIEDASKVEVRDH